MIRAYDARAARLARWITETIPSQMTWYAAQCQASVHQSAHLTAMRQCQVWAMELHALPENAALMSAVSGLVPGLTTAAIQGMADSLKAIEILIRGLNGAAAAQEDVALAALRAALQAEIA